MVERTEIFLSYAREQEREVEGVAVKLRAKNHEVFFDKKTVKGHVFADRIRAAIHRSDLFVFFVSRASITSRSFALTELGYAQEKWPDPDGRILAFLVDDVDLSAGPPYLVNQLDVQAIEGNFVTGVYDRIVQHLARSSALRSAASADAAPPLSDCCERLVAALALKRQLPPSGSARRQTDDDVDKLVTSIKDRFRPDRDAIVAGAKLKKVIGIGNFGTVWEAADVTSGRAVAVKVFRMERLAEGEMLMRFRRSIRAMEILGDESQLAKSPEARGSIVEFIRPDESTLAFAMELLTGGSLEDIGRHNWSTQEKVAALARIAAAVSYSHETGIIHRDIKPANILLNQYGQPALTDFDIADVRFATRISTTVEGGLGTPVFAAPEQLVDAETADYRADIYSLGRVLHYMLLEHSPGFQVEADPDLADLSKFPPALVEVVRCATQFDPRRRFQSVRELDLALVACLSGKAAWRARAARAQRWTRQHWALLVIMALFVGTSATAAVFQAAVATRETAFRKEEERLRVLLGNLSGKLADSIEAKDKAADRVEELRERLQALRAAPASLERDNELAFVAERLEIAERTLAHIAEQQKSLQRRIDSARRSRGDDKSDLRSTDPTQPDNTDGGFTKTYVAEMKQSLELMAKIAARECKMGDPNPGTAQVRLTFDRGGDATEAAIVGGPYTGTDIGGCIEKNLRQTVAQPLGFEVHRVEALVIPPGLPNCGCDTDDLKCNMRCSVRVVHTAERLAGQP